MSGDPICAIAAAACALGLAAAAPAQEQATAIRGALIHPIAAPAIPDGTIVFQDGVILAVGPADEIAIPDGARVFDGMGKTVLPGLIDTHSHLGVYSWPGVAGNSDGNESTAPLTAQVRALDAFNTQDPAIDLARAGGITTILVLPGSANLVGGEGVVMKLRPNALADEMRMAEAPRQLKMAMGENPKRVYGGRGQMPATRMGIVAKLRESFIKAEEYRDARNRHAERLARYAAELAEHEAGEREERPDRPDWFERKPLEEVLADVLDGEILVQVHCYRVDDIMDILRVADEFGFRIQALHHVLEGYKVADLLAERGIGASTWPDWWGFKLEAWDATPYNMAILANAGVLTAMQSDSPNTIQRFPHEAAKAMKYGMTEQQALESITLAGARMLGIDEWVGTLEPGKHADIAVLSGPWNDMYTLNEMTFIDGELVFVRQDWNVERDAWSVFRSWMEDSE